MSNNPSAARSDIEPSNSQAGGPAETPAPYATTVVRAEVAPATSEEPLHPHLQDQLRELRLRTGSAVPELPMLLRLISSHYTLLDEERRGIVRTMQIMADEARALSYEAHEQRSDHLQIILDHVKETILTVDERGILQSLNLTGEAVFGYSEEEAKGRRLDELVPQIGDAGTVTQGLERLAEATGDTALDLAAREIWCRNRSGEVFPAEIAVSRAGMGRRAIFVVCLRDITERRRSELALRESEARYRALVDHAPEAIVVLDADTHLFVDANKNAERLFGYDRAALLKLRPVDVSPPLQLDGTPSLEYTAGRVARALAGEPQVLEWVHRNATGREFVCEVRLLRLPSANRRLVRGSIADISVRKRAERLAAAEREVLQQLTARVPLPAVLQSITRLVESVDAGSICSVSLLGASATSFASIIAPGLAPALHLALAEAPIGIGSGSCAAAVYLGRAVQVADIAKDPFWARPRTAALAAGLRAAWSMPIKAADGSVLGALGVYRREAALPSETEAQEIDHAAQLAGIAIERRLAEEALLASEAKFRGLFESIEDGVYQSGRDGRLLSANPALARMLGYEQPEDLYALPNVAALYWDPADRAQFVRRIEAQGEVRGAECVVRRRDGEQVVLLENARVLKDASGKVTGYEGTVTDITERKRAEQAVFAEKERAQVTLQSIGDAVISTCARGRIEYLNPAAETLTGWTLAEARGRPIGEVLNLVDEATRSPIASPLQRVLGRREAAALDHPVLVTRSSQEIAIQERAAPICDREGRVIGAVVVFRDVTKERRLKRALSYQASHDALTGLINRREFDARLQAAVVSAQAGHSQYALLYIDLDQFKVVNDTCGHQAGDRLMRDITGLLQARVRSSDTIARLGGDEFGVLLDACHPEQARQIAEGVRQGIHSYRFVWGTTTLSVGASIGVVEINRGTQSAASVMSAADLACYAAKDGGRNRIHLYDAGDVSDRHREMHWVARVTRATEERRLELFFQPIVPIGSAQLPPFHELTVRLRDADGRLVAPGEFIPAAERYNVMPAIDRWVVLQAIELLRARPSAAGQRPLLAVNLSGTSLNDQSFLDFLVQHAGDAAVADSLCFEITETVAVTNLSNAIHFMRELQARGCKFSLDDFGSGVSSFMYLKTLPVNFLKIDGQFISQIAHDPIDRSMVEAVSKIGRALGIHTVAECVESAAVLEELKRIGVDFVQGFYLARPRPLADLAQDPSALEARPPTATS